MGRSWRLTKGNSLRIFLFVVLLAVAIGLIGAVLSMLVGLVFALVGAGAAVIGQGVVSGLINAAFYVVFLGVLAAIYRQLAGPAGEPAADNAA